VAFLLVTWVLPDSALAAASETGLASGSSESPASVESIESCRFEEYPATLSNQVVSIEPCVVRLPGGVRAHFFFTVVGGGTANFKGTLHTCTTQFGCRESRVFWLQGVDDLGAGVATDWDSTCPTQATWYGRIDLLDIRFMPSGELHRGTGPYFSYYFRTTAC
jgi:hypothetical protein